MCGILITSRQHVSEAKHKRAAQAMIHRGIRGQNMQSPYWRATHIRLPINGLDEANDQPYVLDKKLGMMVGEYYDFDSKYGCDAKHLIASWLVEPFEYVPGMYHGVIIEEKIIRVYQDDLGKKPIYFRKDIPAIASEIKALTALGPCTWDEEYEEAVSQGNLPPLERTPYNEIARIPPSTIHDFFLVNGVLLTSPILYIESAKKTMSQHLERLEVALLRAIEKRFRADIPIGMLCSGGLDSSLLYYMARQLGYHPYVYHIGNQEEKYLQMLDVPPDRLVPLKIPQCFDLKKVLYYNETYLDRGSMVPQYFLGQAFKNGDCRVVITGDGADELFAGYKRAQKQDTRAYDLEELKIWHLPRIDKMMMSGTVETRSPYLDQEVIRVAQIMDYEDVKGKAPLKKLAELYKVPDEIIEREKKPLRYKAYETDRDSWRRTLLRTFKSNFEKRLSVW